MSGFKELGAKFKEKLGMKYEPVGIYFSDEKPVDSLSFKNKGNGCIAPLIFKAASGKTIAVDSASTGFPCSAFYLGYQEWIFPGIENFLSNGPFPNRECERLIQTSESAKEYVETFIPQDLQTKALVFKPVSSTEERPEAVVFFVNPDQLSALTFLAHFDSPSATDRVVTQLASSCASIVYFPLKYAAEKKFTAFWGLHDISTRTSFPSNIFSFGLPADFFLKMGEFLDKSFIETERWEKVLHRIKAEE